MAMNQACSNLQDFTDTQLLDENSISQPFQEHCRDYPPLTRFDISSKAQA
jgi:hypothetical protein